MDGRRKREIRKDDEKEGRLYSLVFTVYNKLKREPDADTIPSMTCILVLTIHRFRRKSSRSGGKVQPECGAGKFFGKNPKKHLKKQKDAVS